MRHLLWQKSGRWLISKIPTWFLHYLVWRDCRLDKAGHLRNTEYWAGTELWLRAESAGTSVLWSGCSCDPHIGENCELCQPVGVPKLLAEKPKYYEYGEEPAEGLNKPVDDRITVWLYHSDVMSRIGEKTLLYGKVYDITEAGLVPYRGEKDDE